MEIQLNVFRSSFSEAGVEEVIKNTLQNILEKQQLTGKVFVESTSLKEEREYEEDGEPNLDFDCEVVIELDEVNHLSKEEIQQILDRELNQ
jgi:hypothetical protein